MQNIGYLSFEIKIEPTPTTDYGVVTDFEVVDVVLIEHNNGFQKEVKVLEKNLSVVNDKVELKYLINKADHYDFVIKVVVNEDSINEVLIENLIFIDHQGNRKNLLPYKELYKSAGVARAPGVLGKDLPNFAINLSKKPFVDHVPYTLLKQGYFDFIKSDFQLSFTIN